MNYKKLVLTAATAGPLLVGLAPAATAAPTSVPAASASQVAKPAPVSYKQYYNRVKRMCMDSKKGVRVTKCRGKKHPEVKFQLWALRSDGTLRTKVGGKCLTVMGTSSYATAGKCVGNKSKWTWYRDGMLRHKATKQCLTSRPGTVLLTVRKCGSTMGGKWRRD